MRSACRPFAVIAAQSAHDTAPYSSTLLVTAPFDCAYCNAFMSIEVKIPAVGESISSGIVSVWHKKSGEHVKAGDPLFTLETDKVSTEIVAEKAGVLKRWSPKARK